MSAVSEPQPDDAVLRVAAVVEQSWHRVPGGTATSTVQLLDALQRRSDIDLVGLAASHRDDPSADVVPPIPVAHMRLGRQLLYQTWQRFDWPRVQARTGPVSVVHATGGVVPPAGDAALVVTIHDLAFVHRPEHFTKHGVRILHRALDRARDLADAIIVPSQASASDCVANGLAAQRIHVVPWGVHRAAVDGPARQRVSDRYGLRGRFVLWVGTAEPRKNLPRLLAAHERVSHTAAAPVPLVLVGPDGWGVDLDEMIGRSRAPVHHIGTVPEADLRVLYDLADVVAYPSLMEGFGMPVLEAMAQGAVVVTSRGTATEEVAGGAAVLVDPFDIDSIADGLEQALGDAEIRDRLRSASRERAESLTWDSCGERTVEVYQRAATERGL